MEYRIWRIVPGGRCGEDCRCEKSMLQIRHCGFSDSAQWDDYAQSHPGSTIYHLSGWRRVIEETFGHRTFYLLALGQGQPVGILPLVLMESRIFGCFLTSLPFFNYGGVVANSAAVERALVDEAIAIADREEVQHLELRHSEEKALGLVTRAHKLSLRLDLPKQASDLWAGFKAKLRSQILRPQKEGLTARIGGIEELDNFYRVFSTNMRDLGTPVYPKRFFRAILREFPDKTRICATFLRDRPVAAGFLVSFRRELEIPWASSLRRYNPLSPNMLLYWTVLSYACQSGHERFDFGRSTPGGSTYRFKEQWGARPFSLYWQYWLKEGISLPDLSPENPKYQTAIRAWRRLPVRVANLFGPGIIKYVP